MTGVIEVRDGLRLVIARATWPNGEAMVTFRYSTRTPSGGWVDAAAKLAFPARLSGAVVAALGEAGGGPVVDGPCRTREPSAFERERARCEEFDALVEREHARRKDVRVMLENEIARRNAERLASAQAEVPDGKT